MFVVHRSMGIFIATLVFIHIGAALYHHLVLKDGVLKRMVSG
jgi:cytochrome b561